MLGSTTNIDKERACFEKKEAEEGKNNVNFLKHGYVYYSPL